MDRIEKFFHKLPHKDAVFLEKLLEDLLDKSKRNELQVKKLKGSDFYRLRKRRFRIIFHFEKDDVIIDAIRLLDDNTYRDI